MKAFVVNRDRRLGLRAAASRSSSGVSAPGGSTTGRLPLRLPRALHRGEPRSARERPRQGLAGQGAQDGAGTARRRRAQGARQLLSTGREGISHASTGHPGARVYLGVVRRRAAPRPEPARAVRRVALHPQGDRRRRRTPSVIVAGRRRRDRGATASRSPRSSGCAIEPRRRRSSSATVGSTVTFREIHDQLVIKDASGKAFLKDALESKDGVGRRRADHAGVSLPLRRRRRQERADPALRVAARRRWPARRPSPR